MNRPQITTDHGRASSCTGQSRCSDFSRPKYDDFIGGRNKQLKWPKALWSPNVPKYRLVLERVHPANVPVRRAASASPQVAGSQEK